MDKRGKQIITLMLVLFAAELVLFGAFLFLSYK